MKSSMSLRNQARHTLAKLIVKANVNVGGTEFFSGYDWKEGFIVGDNRTSVRVKNADVDISGHTWKCLIDWVEQSHGIYCRKTYLPVVGVGIWTDPDTGIIYLDRVTLTFQRSVAKELAKLRGEICVWDAANECAIMTEDL